MPAEPDRPETGLYEELGVAPTTALPDIRRAYLALARRHHPDRHESAAPEERTAAAARMARVNAAWNVLSHPARRAAYDAGRAHGATGGATVRQPDDGFRPLEDDDEWVDPRLLDDTPSGAPAMRRGLAFLPAALLAAGSVSVILGAMLGFLGVLAAGFVLVGAAGLSFLLLPLVALVNAVRGEERAQRRPGGSG